MWENVIVEVVNCCQEMLEYVLNTSTNVFCQYCFLSGEKAFEVKQSWGASAKLLEIRPPPRWTGRGQLNEGVMFGELRVLLFVLGVCMTRWEWMFE